MAFLWWGKKKSYQVYVVVNTDRVYKSKMIRLNGGKVLIQCRVSGGDEWRLASLDGTFDGREGRRWFYTCQSDYDPEKILNAILKKEDLLPTLTGINKDLDKIIAERTKKDIEIN